MTTRMVTLSATAEGAENYVHLFQHLSELAVNLPDCKYVSVSASVLDDNPDEPDQICCDHEHLHYDEKTLQKVRGALTEALAPFGFHGQEEIGSLICAMQNAGILFRERKIEEYKG